MATTIKPVTLDGWYENTDGTVSEMRWREGRVVEVRSCASWADVPSREDDLAALAAGDAASRG